MKAHKYWSLGALACMAGCFYTGCKKLMQQTLFFLEVFSFFRIGSTHNQFHVLPTFLLLHTLEAFRHNSRGNILYKRLS